MKKKKIEQKKLLNLKVFFIKKIFINFFIKIIPIFLYLFLTISYVKAQCELKEIPFFEINEDELFYYNLSFKTSFEGLSNENDVKISLIPINSKINPDLKKYIDTNNVDINNTEINNIDIRDIEIKNNKEIKTYIITFRPNSSNNGKNSFLVVSTLENGCYDVKKLDFFVYLKPKIIEKYPEEDYIEIYETQYIKFNVNATSYYDKDIKTEWYLNSIKISENKNSFILFTNFSDSGLKKIEFVAKDKRQNKTIKWEINVKNKNRNPILRYNIPDLVLSNFTRGALLNLNDYFQDPDFDRLNYNFFFVDEFNDSLIYNESKVFDIKINNNEFEIYPKMNINFKEFIIIKAYDNEGLNAYSNKFFLKLTNNENITKLFLNNSNNENKKCEVKIECSEWSKCMPTNIMTRECYDINNCNGENKIITETKECEYNATCFDGIKNQDEIEVDCGGICDPCPSCNDGILNQNEEKVDCGGICDPCPSCNDGILNQDETDIDCGGICEKCDDEKKCLSHKDCKSFNCINNTCAIATCFDNKLNQNEIFVDCGGVCDPCPSCNDGILNQNEEKVDCGGNCLPCENCFDGIKNQNEIFVDCGGNCKSCFLLEIINFIKRYYYFGFLIIALIFVYIHLQNLSNREKIKNNLIYSKFFRFLPNKIPSDYKNIFEKTINNLDNLKKDILNLEEKNKINENYFNIINNFYKEFLDLEILNKITIKNGLKKIINPFLRDLLYQLYVDSITISAESPFYRIEINEKIDYTISLLNQIEELL